jgi:hypothetical protein
MMPLLLSWKSCCLLLTPGTRPCERHQQVTDAHRVPQARYLSRAGQTWQLQEEQMDRLM